MSRCPDCGRRVGQRDHFCPHCSSELDDRSAIATENSGGSEWEAWANDPPSTIARFHNAAEAGYFAHELMTREALPVQLTLDEVFDAHGYWRTSFLLKVPHSQAQPAAEALQRLIDQTDADEWQAAEALHAVPVAEADFADERSPSPENSIHWVPIVLTLAAGSFVLWAARKAHEPPHAPVRPAGREHSEFWRDVSRGSQPWVQRLDNGLGVRELWIDADAILLREDADGNGQFERQHRIEDRSGAR